MIDDINEEFILPEFKEEYIAMRRKELGKTGADESDSPASAVLSTEGEEFDDDDSDQDLHELLREMQLDDSKYDDDTAELEAPTSELPSNWDSLSTAERIEHNTEREAKAPRFVPGHAHFALFLTSPGCRFKEFAVAREFLSVDGPSYANLHVEYIGGDPRISFYRSLEARSKGILDPRDYSEEELIRFFTEGLPDDIEPPVATVALNGLTLQEVRTLMEMYGLDKSFPRVDFPPLQ